MLATPDLIALINSNPDGMTTAQVAAAFSVEPNKAAHRLARAAAYGLILKGRAAAQTHPTHTALWLPKAKAS